MPIWTCSYCGVSFYRTRPSHRYKFCSWRCSALANPPSQANIIPDGQPMSKMTRYRRRKAAGLVKPAIHHPPLSESLFTPWSHDLAWLTGIIWSDGYLQKSTVEICAKDRSFIEMIAKLIDRENSVLPKNKGKAWRVCFTSKPIATMFRKIGLTENKSLTITWPNIPEPFQGDFVRGVLDGDGSVILSHNRKGQQVPDLRVNFCGASYPFLEGFTRWLSLHNIRYSLDKDANSSTRNKRPEHKKWHKMWKIIITHHPSARNLYFLLYPQDRLFPCLRRKKENYEKWLHTPRAKTGRVKFLSSPPSQLSLF